MKNLKHCLQFIILILSLSLYSNTFAAEKKILAGRTSSSEGKTRIVLEFDTETSFHAFELHNPDRFVLDINQAKSIFPLASLSSHDSIVKNIRSAAHEQNDLRVVFDLKSPVTINEFWVPASSNSKPRLVIDFTEGNKSSTSTQTSIPIQSPVVAIEKPKEDIAKPFSTPTEKTSFNFKNPFKNNKRNFIVVIDPGHGGKDTGANGQRGSHEKDVVLSISKSLQRRLNSISGMNAILTRDSDFFIPLRGRLNIARKHKADLFIAIHADAYINNHSRGASVYALSERGASSESARWLAVKENDSELGGVSNFHDKSYLVRSVLLDLSQTVTITQSLQMGRMILDTLGQLTVLHHNNVEQAGFVVLKSPDIPSLLIETGFITNPYEEARLTNAKYQDQLAQCIAYGVIQYFVQHPHHTKDG
ncbi:MAG: N-acetylmuramoyl-L-alanine amidase [Gammaproteobacteria bacterium]